MGGLSAQQDTANHRAVYQDINSKAGAMQAVSGEIKGEDGVVKLTGWKETGVLRKIVAKSAGGEVTEYYLEGEKPLFVFRMSKDGDGNKVEERLYFKDGEIFKWLTTEKNAPVFHAEDYQATTEMHLTDCQAYVSALKKDKAAPLVVEGTFSGIEQGDYAHWNIKTKDGEERSFFVMKADAEIEKVLENPRPHVGKACRVTWKKSMEEIPEAGGKMEIEQVVAVEWVK
jgi:hypothetical protein